MLQEDVVVSSGMKGIQPLGARRLHGAAVIDKSVRGRASRYCCFDKVQVAWAPQKVHFQLEGRRAAMRFANLKPFYASEAPSRLLSHTSSFESPTNHHHAYGRHQNSVPAASWTPEHLRSTFWPATWTTSHLPSQKLEVDTFRAPFPRTPSQEM